MRYVFTLVMSFFFVLSAIDAAAQKRVAIIGSSTSACTGPSVPDSCYVARLRAFYNKQMPNDTTIDNGYAVGGYNVYKGMPSSYTSPYGDPSFQPDPGHNISAALQLPLPDVVLVNYPSNSYDVLSLTEIMFCLRTIRDSANIKGVPCFITTTQARTSGASYNTPAIKLKLAALKDSILLQFGSFAIDFWTGLINPADSSLKHDSGDQIHMNNPGHDSLYRRVLAKNIFLATLPATFLQFNTVYKNKTNIISWSTAKEKDVAFYEIQRSGDGLNFSKITTVTANNSYGNNQYQFTDEQFLKGWNYYKIVIVDKDGKKHASPVMKVFINAGKLALVKAYVPGTDQVAVELQNNEPQHAELQILNSMGMVISKISRKIEAGSTILYVHTPVLSNGVYYLKLTTATESMVSSFIKN